MNRQDLKGISRLRLREAKVLLQSKCYDGAYYLLGYSIECGLKACIAKLTKRHDFPDKRTVNSSYTHNLSELLKVAGLERALASAAAQDPDIELNWTIVKDWSEDSRYRVVTPNEAKDLYQAVVGRQGILKWLRQHW